MKKISFFATDLDGTLFYDRVNINECDKNALKRLKEIGSKVCFATGRELEIILPAVERNNLWEYVDYFLMCGGSQIYDVKNKKIQTLGELSVKDIQYIYKTYNKCPVSMILPKDNILHTNKITNELLKESKLLNSPIKLHEDMLEFLNEPQVKFLLFGSKEQIDFTMDKMKNNDNENITVCRSQEQYIDCYAKGIDKGTGIKTLCKQLNIPLDETASIGDNQNDIDMFKVTAFSACPENGTEQAKKNAQYNVCSAKDGAVCDFCKKLGIL